MRDGYQWKRREATAAPASAQAARIATSRSTVNHLFAKIDARDRAQAVGYAYRHGLVAQDG